MNIKDEEPHYLIDSELERLPEFHAVYTLYNIVGPIEVGTGTLRDVVPVAAAARNPSATPFPFMD